MSRYRWEVGEIVSPLPARVFIEHDEQGSLELATREEVREFARMLDYSGPDDQLVRIVAEGSYFDGPSDDPEREEKSTAATSQIRALLLGTDTALSPTFARREECPPRWLIPYVWEMSTFPQFSGESKAGKSRVIIEIILTLLVPGYKFLGVYGGGDISREELERGLVLLNMENPPGAVEDALRPLESVPFTFSDGRVGTARELVRVYHLREMGGPGLFDPRNPEKFEAWRRVLTRCDECDGDDNWGPFAIFADNGTAVLRALGENVQEHIGEWFESFRQLCSEIDTLQGIGVAHATLDGKHALGGTISSAASDGEWMYTRRGNAGSAPRYFSITPRLGAVPPLSPTKVTQDAEGRLHLATAAPTTSEPASATPAPQVAPKTASDEHEGDVLEVLRAAGSAGLTKSEATGQGRVGTLRRTALGQLLEQGLVTREREGRGERWRVVQTPDNDGEIQL